MVAISIVLNRLYYPTPYAFGRMAEYVVLALVLFVVAEQIEVESVVLRYTLSTAILVLYVAYAVWREKIDVKSFVKHILRRG